MADDIKTSYLTGRTSPVSNGLLSVLNATAGDVIWLDTGLITPEECKSYLFTGPLDVLRCDSLEELPGFFRGIEQALKQGFWLAGWFCYEWGYLLNKRMLSLLDLHRPQLPLALLLMFREPYILSHGNKGVPPLETVYSNQPMPHCAAQEMLLDVTHERYLSAIAQIKGYIGAGDTYQVNYTLRNRFKVPEDCNPLSLYLQLRESQPVPYGAFMRIGTTHVLSCSPELFFRRDGELLVTRPMKGTAGRGRTVQEDRERAERLHVDIKNRAENIMIVDLLRNDLGRIAAIGSVEAPELFRVERYSTLFQMTSTVQAQIADNCSYEQILRSLFPSGSVTGAPKLRTMEIIAELENSARGIYTGAIGFISPLQTACFNVAIRTLVMNEGRAELGIGSGVTIGSDPHSEYEECRLKADFLFKHRQLPDFELIETMLWNPQGMQEPGRPLARYLLLGRHLRRMADSAHYFDFIWNEEEVLQRLAGLSQQLTARCLPVRVRMSLSRSGRITIKWQDWPLAPNSHELAPVSIAGVFTSSQDVFLYHKTTHRPVYDAEYAKAAARRHFDCIFLNERNEVTEGAITNVFIKRQGSTVLFTPPVSCGLLNGTLRQELLETGKAAEDVLYLHDLRTAEAVFVGNSVRGLKQVQLTPFEDAKAAENQF